MRLFTRSELAILCLVPVFMTTSVTRGGQPEAADDALAAKEFAEETEGPQVVAVFPPDGATDVNPVTELRIRFDRPMSPSSAFIKWDSRRPGGFRSRGPLQYDPEKYEFLLPVVLTPDFSHSLIVHGGEHSSGFRSEDDSGAAEFLWSFRTVAVPEARAGQAPRIVAVEPPADSEVPLYNLVRVRFDRPMDPDWYGIAFEDPGRRRRSEKPSLHSSVTYDPDLQEFELPLVMPPNWNGEFQLTHFRAADGTVIQPQTVKYRTLRQPTSSLLKQRIEQSGESPLLIDLIRKIGDQSRKVTSVSAEVRFSQVRSNEGWSNHYSSWAAGFARSGQQFIGDVSQAMQKSWQIGSDGTTSWFRHGDTVVQCPAEDVSENNVVLCNPFGAGTEDDVRQVIETFQLEHLGEVDLHSRRCHRIRSWSGVERWWKRAERIGEFTDWYIDAESLMLVQIERNGSRARFRYTNVNGEIPVERFQPPVDEGLKIQPPEALDADYTRRFLSVADGSHGVMLARWGRKGPKGIISSGLNANWR